MEDLGTLGGSESEALAVSADGRVVVGMAEDERGQRRAFRWTSEGGMEDLGTLGGSWSQALAVSADGRVVVGMAEDARGRRRAFRWTAETGMEDLGTLGGWDSKAVWVSEDGQVVVGVAQDKEGVWHTFHWQKGKMRRLKKVYGGLLSRGSMFWGAPVVSYNGRYMAGTGYNAAHHRVEIFLLDAAGLLMAMN